MCKTNDNKKQKVKQSEKNNNDTTAWPLTSIAGPVVTLCKSRACNDVVWDVGPSSYTTSYPGPSRGKVVFVGPYHRADTPF